MTAVSPRVDGPAPISRALTVGDLEAGRFTAEQLEAYVPQTRAEARALMAAKAAVENPTRRSRAAQREAARHRSTRGAARREVAGRSFTRPRQAVALLALTGVMGAAQATASAGSSPGAEVIAAQATGLLSFVTPSAQPEAASRDNVRPAIEQSLESEPLDDVTVSAAETDARRAEAVAAKVAVLAEQEAAAKAAEEAAAAAAAQAAQDAARAAEEQARATANWPLVAPLVAPVISGFGGRIHPVYGTYRMHTGDDFSIGCGANVAAAAAGKVVESGWGGGYGNRIVIDHGTVDGVAYRTTYNHLSSRTVNVGQTVTTGQSIGLVGTTGTSTGCHLHFEVERNGTLVDPANYL